jgi:hypothetical protein
VRRRRDGDKLNHFMRWCGAITDGLSKEEALSFVRSILPRNLIGDHAYGHWETHVGLNRQFFGGRFGPKVQTQQSFIDSARCRLRRTLEIDPDLQRRLNREIKRRRPPDEQRRLLLGIHDVDAFVAAVADIYGSPPTHVERAVLIELISEIDGWNEKGGLRPPFRFPAWSEQPYTAWIRCSDLPITPGIPARDCGELRR